MLVATWLRQIIDLRDSDSMCTDLPPLRKNQRRGVCDSLLLIMYGGHVIVPGICAKLFDWLLLVDHYIM